MSTLLNSKQRRLAAILLLVLATALVCSITLLPVALANSHYREIISELEYQLVKYRQAAAAESDLQPQYERLQRWQTRDSQYLKSTSTALAAAELQSLINRIVDAQQADLLSTQILAPVTDQGITRIKLKIRLRGTLEDFVHIFHAIETSQPFMFLDNISLRANGGRQGRRQLTVPQLLDVDLELYGYMPGAAS